MEPLYLGLFETELTENQDYYIDHRDQRMRDIEMIEALGIDGLDQALYSSTICVSVRQWDHERYQQRFLGVTHITLSGLAPNEAMWYGKLAGVLMMPYSIEYCGDPYQDVLRPVPEVWAREPVWEPAPNPAVFSWYLSREERNRRMHTLTGNTSKPRRALQVERRKKEDPGKAAQVLALKEEAEAAQASVDADRDVQREKEKELEEEKRAIQLQRLSDELSRWLEILLEIHQFSCMHRATNDSTLSRVLGPGYCYLGVGEAPTRFGLMDHYQFQLVGLSVVGESVVLETSFPGSADILRRFGGEEIRRSVDAPYPAPGRRSVMAVYNVRCYHASNYFFSQSEVLSGDAAPADGDVNVCVPVDFLVTCARNKVVQRGVVFDAVVEKVQAATAHVFNYHFRGPDSLRTVIEDYAVASILMLLGHHQHDAMEATETEVRRAVLNSQKIIPAGVYTFGYDNVTLFQDKVLSKRVKKVPKFTFATTAKDRTKAGVQQAGLDYRLLCVTMDIPNMLPNKPRDSSAANVLAAARKRLMADIPEPTEAGRALLSRTYEEILAMVEVPSYSEDEWPEQARTYAREHGFSAEDLERTLALVARLPTLSEDEVAAAYSDIKTFLKDEMYPSEKDEAYLRFICVVPPEWRFVAHALVHPAEKSVLQSRLGENSVKGLTPAQRRVKVRHILAHARGLVSDDYTSMEQQISGFLRKLEAGFFGRLMAKFPYPNVRQGFIRGLTSLVKLKTPVGEIVRQAMRCSGEAHTSTGNFIANIVLTYATECLALAAIQQEPRPLESFLSAAVFEGDDSVVRIDERLVPQFSLGTSFFSEAASLAGGVIKPKYSDSLAGAVFCKDQFDIEVPTPLGAICPSARPLRDRLIKVFLLSKASSIAGTDRHDRKMLIARLLSWCHESYSPIALELLDAMGPTSSEITDLEKAERQTEAGQRGVFWNHFHAYNRPGSITESMDVLRGLRRWRAESDLEFARFRSTFVERGSEAQGMDVEEAEALISTLANALASGKKVLDGGMDRQMHNTSTTTATSGSGFVKCAGTREEADAAGAIASSSRAMRWAGRLQSCLPHPGAISALFWRMIAIIALVAYFHPLLVLVVFAAVSFILMCGIYCLLDKPTSIWAFPERLFKAFAASVFLTALLALIWFVLGLRPVYSRLDRWWKGASALVSERAGLVDAARERAYALAHLFFEQATRLRRNYDHLLERKSARTDAELHRRWRVDVDRGSFEQLAPSTSTDPGEILYTQRTIREVAAHRGITERAERAQRRGLSGLKAGMSEFCGAALWYLGDSTTEPRSWISRRLTRMWGTIEHVNAVFMRTATGVLGEGLGHVIDIREEFRHIALTRFEAAIDTAAIARNKLRCVLAAVAISSGLGGLRMRAWAVDIMKNHMDAGFETEYDSELSAIGSFVQSVHSRVVDDSALVDSEVIDPVAQELLLPTLPGRQRPVDRYGRFPGSQ
jgi:hypothetical protein